MTRPTSSAVAPAALLGMLVVLAWTSPAGAQQPFTGTFTVPNDVGGMMSLQLQQSGNRVTGILSSNGMSYQLEGEAEGDGAYGLLQGAQGALWFEAERSDQELWVTLYGSDANGQPNYDDFTEIDFVASTSTASANAGVGGGTSAAGGGAKSPKGSSPVGSPRTDGGRELAPGFTEDHPMVREWVDYLGGMKLTRMESYSSGTAGGYSARTDVYLCSDRRFAMRDESSVSVDVGGAFGNAGGTGGGEGSWYVITNGQVVGLILEYANGQVSEFRMDYQNNETYANGERVYVTAAEVCN